MKTLPVSVLLVEDDPDEKDLFVQFLSERKDLALEEFYESGDAMINSLELREAGAKIPGLFVVDQNMPLVTGFQVLRFLKNSPRFALVPVVIYSTYVDSQLADRCMKAGAMAVYTKPLTAAGYNEMMDEVVSLMTQNGTNDVHSETVFGKFNACKHRQKNFIPPDDTFLPYSSPHLPGRNKPF